MLLGISDTLGGSDQSCYHSVKIDLQICKSSGTPYEGQQLCQFDLSALAAHAGAFFRTDPAKEHADFLVRLKECEGRINRTYKVNSLCHLKVKGKRLKH